MKFAYQRQGGPIITWRNGIPRQTRAADTVALGCCGLGSLEGTSLDGSTILPAPGAPEPIGVTRPAMGGCSCHGSCGCGGGGGALSGLVDSVPGGMATLAVVGLFVAWKVFGKRRRR